MLIAVFLCSPDTPLGKVVQHVHMKLQKVGGLPEGKQVVLYRPSKPGPAATLPNVEMWSYKSKVKVSTTITP
jgi:hypothetical protein